MSTTSGVDHVTWTPPPYADPAKFGEHEIVLDSGGLAVGGCLCVPNSADAPVPAVVLLAGSGPSDRDSTVGPNKPLRDIAWGLAEFAR